MRPSIDESDSDKVISQMRLGVEYRGVLSLRGFKVSARPLTIVEESQITSEVVDELQKLPESARNSQTETTLLAKKYLALATTSGPDKQDFKLNDETLSKMTAGEVDTLYKQYVGLCDKVNPSLEEMKAEDLVAMVERVKKNPGALTALSLTELVNVCRSLLRADSPTGSSSGM